MSAALGLTGVQFEPASNGSTDLGAFYDEQIRPRLSVDLVFDHPSHQWHRSPGKCRGGCPGHTSESGTSFNVSTDTLSWFCPACDVGGGPVQYLHWIAGGSGSPRGRDFVQILGDLAQRVGVQLPERELTDAERKAAEARDAKRAALEMVYRRCEDELWSDRGAEARAYLHGRGLTDDHIHDLGLGLYPKPSKLRKLLRDAGYGAGVDAGVWDKLQGYITFPWRDPFGLPLTLYGRWPSKQANPTGDAKTLALPGAGSKASPLFFDRVRRAHLTEAVLVEGLLDAALGRALGDDRLVAYVGAQPALAQHQVLARHGIMAATICSDPDKGGESGILSFLKNADPSVRTYVAPKLPDGMDPDEFMLAYGIDGWRAHIAKAERGVIWRARLFLSQHDLQSSKGRDDTLATLLDYGSTLDVRDLDDIVKVAADPLGMRPETLRQYLGGLTDRQGDSQPLQGSTHAPAAVPVAMEKVRPIRSRIVALPTNPDLNKISRPGHRPHTDLGNSERLVDKFGDDIRFSAQLGGYLVWNGRCWALDQTGAAVTLAKQATRAIYLEAATADTADERKALSDWARRSEAAARITAMLQLAQSSIPVMTDDLDRDPWLLNARNGTVDLRTGELRPHSRDDFITKMVDVEYHPGAPCARWEQFLEEIQPKEATRRFLRRAAGYSATGSARERVLIILYGVGRNGKSVLLQELRTTLGPYAVRMPSESFLAKRQDGAIPNDIAQLRGARFAFGSETGEGRRLAEAKIKELTGDESISARFMRAEWFDFKPAFTPWLATNHRPVIKGTDAAIWDRIRLVPFNVRFRLPDEPKSDLPVADLTLSEKLDDERAGILAWIVRGASEWYHEGLGAPDEVRSATAVYQKAMDDLADFLVDRCVVEDNATVGSRVLYEAFKSWAEGSGERPLSEKTFSTRIEGRGFRKGRTKATRFFSGLRLRTPIDDPNVDDGLESMTGPGSEIRYDRLSPEVSRGYPGKSVTTRHQTQPVTDADEARPCWQCSKPLSGETDESCPACGWLLCPCGACGCREDDDA